MRESETFARIKSKGDAALFGGWTTRDMKKRLGVPEPRALADFLPTITIKAKDLANEMTSHNVKAKDLRTEQAITSDHVDNNRELRQAMGGRASSSRNRPPTRMCASWSGGCRRSRRSCRGRCRGWKSTARTLGGSDRWATRAPSAMAPR